MCLVIQRHLSKAVFSLLLHEIHPNNTLEINSKHQRLQKAMLADELRTIAKYEARISAYEIRISHLTLKLAEHDRQILMLQDKLLVAEYNAAILPDTHSQEVAELHRAMKIEYRYVRETSSMIDFVEWLKAEPTRNLSFLQKSVHAARERTGKFQIHFHSPLD
jgi:predicted RNase H-like nuclease (RuvC/YqgF family)